jgi:hypothetical protein
MMGLAGGDSPDYGCSASSKYAVLPGLQPARMARIVLLFVLLAMLPSASAQDDPWTLLAEDPKDDTGLSAGPHDDPDVAPLGAAALVVDGPDISGIYARDDDADLVLMVTFHPPDSPVPAFGPVAVRIDLTMQDMLYRARMTRTGGMLYAVDGLGGEHSVAVVSGGPVDATTWNLMVPREALLDETGAPPEKSSVVGVSALWAAAGTARVGSMEFIPVDNLEMSVDYAFKAGLEQTGPGRLLLPKRAVASNGEGAAHAFPFEVRNIDSVAHDFELVVSDLPSASWVPSFTRREIRLEGEGALKDTLVITVPFAHQHGERDQFGLTLRQLDGDGVSPAQLSVYYFQIPQPTGHHNTLYVHVQEVNSTPDMSLVEGDNHRLYMNTRAEDPDSGDAPVTAAALQFPVERYEWSVPLSPELGIPLSFDSSGPGRLRAAFDSEVPQTNVQVGARLVWRGIAGGDEVLVADFPPVAVGDLGNGPQSADVAGKAVVNLVEAVRGKNLVLVIFMTVSNPMAVIGAQTPSLLPGAELGLPLLEYRASTGAGEANDLALALPERTLRLPPGGDGLLNGQVENRADDDIRVDFSITGINSTWFDVPPPQDITARASGAVTIGIHVPDDARDGDLADVILRAIRTDGSSVAERVLVVVSTSANSEGGSQTEVEAPALQPWLLIFGLAALARFQRRRS